MRLKVSPRTALLMIDKMIAEGDRLHSDMLRDFYCEYDECIKHEEENRYKDHFTPRFSSYFLSRQVVSEEFVETLYADYNEWSTSVISKLSEIFIDHAPLFAFSNACGDRSKVSKDAYNTDFLYLNSDFRSKLAVLLDFYKNLETYSRNPLVFVEERSQVCYYDFSCQLTPSTNESALCAFMFRSGIGEWVEMFDAFEYICGTGANDSNWKKVVTSAADGVNRKTGSFFGFSIFKMKKSLICLTIPSRIVAQL